MKSQIAYICTLLPVFRNQIFLSKHPCVLNRLVWMHLLEQICIKLLSKKKLQHFLGSLIEERRVWGLWYECTGFFFFTYFNMKVLNQRFRLILVCNNAPCSWCLATSQFWLDIFKTFLFLVDFYDRNTFWCL